MLKDYIKYMIGYFRRKKAKIQGGGYTYIGAHVNIKGKNITIGSNVIIRPGVDLWIAGYAQIGSGTEIGQRSRISIANALEIGDNVLLSPNVYITDSDHQYDLAGTPIIKQGIVNKDNKVVIESDCYIGINSVLVGDLHIGRGSVIGANSVVTKSIPDYCVAVGAPAKIIKRYDMLSKEWRKM